jgi:hypothetical protein
MEEKKPGAQLTETDKGSAKDTNGANLIRQDKREEIIEGARQEDQLENLKPDPETAEKQDSQTELPNIDDGIKDDEQ